MKTTVFALHANECDHWWKFQKTYINIIMINFLPHLSFQQGILEAGESVENTHPPKHKSIFIC